jgi:peptidoglycan hydrolase CwlO-like protein
MVNYIIQNFSWPTFFLALLIFVLVSNFLNVIKSYLLKLNAEKKVKLAEKKLSDLQAQMKVKEAELDELLNKEGGSR